MAEAIVFRSGIYRVDFEHNDQGWRAAQGSCLAEVVAAHPSIPQVLGERVLNGATSIEDFVTYLGERTVAYNTGAKSGSRQAALFLLCTPYIPGTPQEVVSDLPADAEGINEAVDRLASVATIGLGASEKTDDALEGPGGATIEKLQSLGNGLLVLVGSVHGRNPVHAVPYEPPTPAGQ